MNYRHYLNIKRPLNKSGALGRHENLSQRQKEVRNPRFERWRVKESLGNSRYHLVNPFGEELLFVKSIGRGAESIIKDSTVLVGFYYEDRSDPYIYSLGGVPITRNSIPVYPPILTSWYRIGCRKPTNFFQPGTREEGSSVIRVEELQIPTEDSWITGEIIRVDLGQIIFSDSQFVRTLDASTNSTLSVDLTDSVSALSIGSTGDAVAITHGTHELLDPPVDCSAGYELGIAHGEDFAYDVGLDASGEDDCLNDSLYAWEDYFYEQAIRDAEGDSENFYFWEIPGSVTFEAPEDAECYRDGFIEGCRSVYDSGSTSSGCGSGGGG